MAQVHIVTWGYSGYDGGGETPVAAFADGQKAKDLVKGLEDAIKVFRESRIAQPDISSVRTMVNGRPSYDQKAYEEHTKKCIEVRKKNAQKALDLYNFALAACGVEELGEAFEKPDLEIMSCGSIGEATGYHALEIHTMELI